MRRPEIPTTKREPWAEEGGEGGQRGPGREKMKKGGGRKKKTPEGDRRRKKEKNIGLPV